MNTIKFGKLEILADYGRILKLEAAPGLNVFWNNPADNKTTSYGWFNPGGDRIWISPQSETFMPDGTLSSYTVQKGIDPGVCTVSMADDKTLVMTSLLDVCFFKLGKSVKLQLKRTITEIESDAPAGVSFAGYRQELELTAIEGLENGMRPAIWSVLQLPPGGKIFFPDCDVVHLSGAYPGKQFENGKPVLYAPAKDASFKIGITPENCRGIMAYINESTPTAYLVARNFETTPDGRYADYPLHAPEIFTNQQFYCNYGDLGGFGEMEYHSQYLTCENPVIRTADTVRAYAGTSEEMNGILNKLF